MCYNNNIIKMINALWTLFPIFFYYTEISKWKFLFFDYALQLFSPTTDAILMYWNQI